MYAAKPIWEEGMLVGPEHFRQFEIWLESLLESRAGLLRPYGWGLAECVPDAGLLGAGKLAIARCVAILPGGLPVAWPGSGVLAPPVRDLEPDRAGRIVYLGARARSRDVTEAEWSEETAPGSGKGARYDREPQFARSGLESEAMMVGRVRAYLFFDDEKHDSYASLPILRIGETGTGGASRLDEDFLAPCLDCRAAPRLLRLMAELSGLLRRRAEELSLRADPRMRTGQAPLVDFMMLSLCNEFEAALAHIRSLPCLHPERLFALLAALAGRLAGFVTESRLGARLPPYGHEDPWAGFEPLWHLIVKGLSAETAQRAVSLGLEDRGYGIRIAPVSDRGLLENGRFVLVVKADMQAETLRAQLPQRLKVGPVEEIRNLVNLQLRGIDIQLLPVAPAQLPYEADAIYVELDKNGALWRKLMGSSAFAFHFAGDFPGLSVEFWAIRE